MPLPVSWSLTLPSIRVVESGMGAMGDTRPSEEELNAVNIGGSDSTPGLRMVLLLGLPLNPPCVWFYC